MSRVPVPLRSPDISTFARSVARQMKSRGDAPSHVELMNFFQKSEQSNVLRIGDTKLLHHRFIKPIEGMVCFVDGKAQMLI